ncbi:MAG TPA: hypothetical protein VMA09_01220 [Candidatus Binataceae bacterium]|nr:hypothetical protein [Candidatus Binataceae bacterium]
MSLRHEAAPRRAMLALELGALIFLGSLTGCTTGPWAPDKPNPPQVVYVPVAPTPPPNPNKTLLGTWSAVYPGRPLQVVVSNDQLIRGTNYIATLVDHTPNIPAGSVVFRGKPDRNVATLVVGKQACADSGYTNVRWIDATIMVVDTNTLKEQLVHPGECRGYPTKWIRVVNSAPNPTASD